MTTDPRQMTDFQSRVAFDTFDNKYATDFSLTLRSKHPGYMYSRLSRTFLCGVDDNPYSKTAVQWLFEDLAEDGDEIICLRVIDPSNKLNTSDSALQEKKYRDEASLFLSRILECNTLDCKVSFVLEFAVGKVQNMIQRMIEIYEPAILVVGTKGRSLDGFKGLLPGSVSKYCLQHSPVPVVVVRPSQKREKKKQQREMDPSRRKYKELLKVYQQDGDDLVKVYQQGATGDMPKPDLPLYLTTPLDNEKNASGASLLPSQESKTRSRSIEPSQNGIRSPSPSPSPSSSSGTERGRRGAY